MTEKTIGFYIGAIHRGAHKYFEKYLKPLGIHRGMLRILMELSDSDSLSQKDITDRLVTDRANTARLLQRMEDDGLILRIVDQDDRRNRIVSLTERGRELVQPVEQVLRRWVDMITQGMSETEKECYLALLQRSFTSIEDYFAAVDE